MDPLGNISTPSAIRTENLLNRASPEPSIPPKPEVMTTGRSEMQSKQHRRSACCSPRSMGDLSPKPELVRPPGPVGSGLWRWVVFGVLGLRGLSSQAQHRRAPQFGGNWTHLRCVIARVPRQCMIHSNPYVPKLCATCRVNPEP